MICLLWKIMSEPDFVGGNGGVTLHRTGRWVRNIFLFATCEQMPVVHRSIFGGSYLICLKQYSQKLHLFETKLSKKVVPGRPTLCSALRIWSSSPGRLSVVQLLHTDSCSWSALKGYQALHFQTSYLHKCLSAFIFQERKRNSCIGKL